MKRTATAVRAPARARKPAKPAAGKAGKVKILSLGHTAFKITTPGGKEILINPYLLKNPLTPPEYKNFDALGHIDIILVTHGEPGHLGDAPEIAKYLNVPMYGPQGMNQTLTTLGILPAALSPRMGLGGTIKPFGPDIRITQVHAEHSSEMLLVNPATGKPETHAAGLAVGYIIKLENGFTVYHMGDTALFGDLKFFNDYYKPDLIIIPIGGHFLMDPVDAAYATRHWLKVKYAIPTHYGKQPLLAGTPGEYIKALGKSRTKVLVMTPGDTLTF